MLQGGERRGIIVTSTGLLFVNARDGKLRAYDADTGDILWTFTLPAGTQGIPAMYEVKGRQYLNVNATSPMTSGDRRVAAVGAGRARRRFRGLYMTFALPDLKGASNAKVYFCSRRQSRRCGSWAPWAPVLGVGPSFRPDLRFSGSSLSGWNVLGYASWRAENGEIIGTPKAQRAAG